MPTNQPKRLTDEELDSHIEYWMDGPDNQNQRDMVSMLTELKLARAVIQDIYNAVPYEKLRISLDAYSIFGSDKNDNFTNPPEGEGK